MATQKRGMACVLLGLALVLIVCVCSSRNSSDGVESPGPQNHQILAIRGHLEGQRRFHGMPLAVSRENLDRLDELWIDLPPPGVNEPWIDYPAEPIDTTAFPLFVALITRPDAYERRMTLRSTLFQKPEFRSGQIKGMMFVGASGLDEERIRDEIEMYGDLVVFKQNETYHTLPIKVFSMIHWITTYYPNAKHIAKMDDDLYLSVRYVMEASMRQCPDDGVCYQGYLQSNDYLNRNPLSHLYVSVEDYPEDKCPTYAFGGCYVISKQLGRLIMANRPLKFCPLEDVTMGVEIDQIHRVNPVTYCPLGPFIHLPERWRGVLDPDKPPALIHPLDDAQLRWVYQLESGAPYLGPKQIVMIKDRLEECAPGG